MISDGAVATAHNAGQPVVRLGLRLILSGLCLIAIQWAIWFAEGQWASCDLGDIVAWVCTPNPSVSWVFHQETVASMLRLPLSGLLIGGGLLFGLLGALSSLASGPRNTVS